MYVYVIRTCTSTCTCTVLTKVQQKYTMYMYYK